MARLVTSGKSAASVAADSSGSQKHLQEISSINQIKGAEGARQTQTWAPAPGLAGGEGMGGDGWGGRVVSLAAGGPRSSSSESGSTSSGQE